MKYSNLNGGPHIIMFNSITSIYIGYIQYIPIIGMVYTESAS